MTSRTVQIHLNRRCNLACAHCYSQSGPEQREQLALADILTLLCAARQQGYSSAAFSGGEPFLYRDFATVLEAAGSLGFRRLAVTNGTVFQGGRDALLDQLDLVAVSVDGPEDVHNAIRQSPTAYARMLDGLAIVRAHSARTGMPFGIAHTVTKDSLPSLSFMAEFAHRQGAHVLQLHPLGMVGAATNMGKDALGGEILARAYLSALALQADYAGRMAIHVDLFNRDLITSTPEMVIPGEPWAKEEAPNTADQNTAFLSNIINPLVVMSNGDVSPICHAMPAHLRLGNIAQEPLTDMAARFYQKGLPQLQSLCRTLWQEVVSDSEGWPWLNWYELLETRAQEQKQTQQGRQTIML